MSKKLKRLRNLAQYKDMSDEELQKIVDGQDVKLESKKEVEYNLNSMFSDDEQKNIAADLLKKYLKEYAIETISDKNLLSQLIHLEVYHYKIQKKINSFDLDGEYKSYQLKDLTESLHKNLDQILNLKQKLGLVDNKQQQKSDAFQALDLLKKKFKIWCENNQASRFLICPHCSREVLLRIKTEAWDAAKHPFFKDRILGNEHLIKLYKENRLTKEDLSLVLGTSQDYIDWLVDRWKIVSLENKEENVVSEVASP